MERASPPNNGMHPTRDTAALTFHPWGRALAGSLMATANPDGICPDERQAE